MPSLQQWIAAYALLLTLDPTSEAYRRLAESLNLAAEAMGWIADGWDRIESQQGQTEVPGRIDEATTAFNDLGDALEYAMTQLDYFTGIWKAMTDEIMGEFDVFMLQISQFSLWLESMAFMGFDLTPFTDQIWEQIGAWLAYLGTLDPNSEAYKAALAALWDLLVMLEKLGVEIDWTWITDQLGLIIPDHPPVIEIDVEIMGVEEAQATLTDLGQDIDTAINLDAVDLAVAINTANNLKTLLTTKRVIDVDRWEIIYAKNEANTLKGILNTSYSIDLNYSAINQAITKANTLKDLLNSISNWKPPVYSPPPTSQSTMPETQVPATTNPPAADRSSPGGGESSLAPIVNVIVHEAGPETYVEIVDDIIEPRLKETDEYAQESGGRTGLFER